MFGEDLAEVGGHGGEVDSRDEDGGEGEPELGKFRESPELGLVSG